MNDQEIMQLRVQNFSKNQNVVFLEIVDVLRALCHTHSLPLALTWIRCPFENDFGSQLDGENVTTLLKSDLLCVQESACYVNDRQIKGFVHACAEHHLEKEQGIVGKTLQSNHPFFCPDVKSYNVLEYPLAHHARKFGLNAAIAIRLRSTYTGDYDYILELFLPISCKGNADQQLLLNNLSITMQKMCKSLRTITEAELDRGACSNCHGKFLYEHLHEAPFEKLSRVNQKVRLSQKPVRDNKKLDVKNEQVLFLSIFFLHHH